MAANSAQQVKVLLRNYLPDDADRKSFAEVSINIDMCLLVFFVQHHTIIYHFLKNLQCVMLCDTGFVKSNY